MSWTKSGVTAPRGPQSKYCFNLFNIIFFLNENKNLMSSLKHNLSPKFFCPIKLVLKYVF